MTAVALDLRALTLDELMTGFARASNDEYHPWLEEIERRLRKRLQRMFLNMGVMNQDVDDFVNLTWVAMIQYRDSFPQVKDGLAWVRHIAKREVQRYFRDQKRQKRAPQLAALDDENEQDDEDIELDADADIFAIDEELDEVDHEMKSPLEYAMEAERRERVREHLSQLTERQREIVELFYYLGLSDVQVAERLGIALGTVKATLSQARTILRELLANMESSCTPPASES
jgi:RNA polymerase sigma factor (sigma-70 family)